MVEENLITKKLEHATKTEVSDDESDCERMMTMKILEILWLVRTKLHVDVQLGLDQEMLERGV